MSYWKNYHLAQNIDDALQALTATQGSAWLVAGGTDLLLDLQQGRHPPVDTLVDITAIPDLNVLELRQHELFIGAAVPLNRIVASQLVRQHAECLVEACGLIGGPQVRNTATLGGNVAHALPAGDGTIALVALNAQVEIASIQGCRRAPIQDLFLGPGRSTLQENHELLTGFYLPLSAPGQGSVHRRVMRPQGVAIAILNMAGWITRQDERISAVQIALGPAGPTPQRARKAEALLTGQSLNDATISAALEALLSEVRLRTSPHRATAEYRRHLAGILLHDVLTTAWQRAEMNR